MRTSVQESGTSCPTHFERTFIIAALHCVRSFFSTRSPISNANFRLQEERTRSKHCSRMVECNFKPALLHCCSATTIGRETPVERSLTFSATYGCAQNGSVLCSNWWKRHAAMHCVEKLFPIRSPISNANCSLRTGAHAMQTMVDRWLHATSNQRFLIFLLHQPYNERFL